MALSSPLNIGDGALLYKAGLSFENASKLAADVWALASQAGWISPITPKGKPFSVRQVNFGGLGWVSDREGYRYEKAHPYTAKPWPPLPQPLLTLWSALIDETPPDCCLVNYYDENAKMGLHRDADEEDLTTPVLSISLGQQARFRLGTSTRGGATTSVILEHGDVLVLGAASRRAYHGIDRIYPSGLSDPQDVPFFGRLNLTLRRVWQR